LKNEKIPTASGTAIIHIKAIINGVPFSPSERIPLFHIAQSNNHPSTIPPRM
jgi:hypothetical protein